MGKLVEDKMKKRGKRILAKWIFGVTMAVAMITNSMCVDTSMTKVEAATNNYGLQNPRIDKDGYTTWDRIEFGSAKWHTSSNYTWIVLSVNGNDAFLMSTYGVETFACNPMSLLKNPTSEQLMHRSINYTWESSWVRKWLNGYTIDKNVWNPYLWVAEPYEERNSLIEELFTKEEQQALIPTKVVNNGNAIYNTSGGPDTVDKVYLPSMEEVSNPAYGFNAVFDGESRTRVNEWDGPDYWWLRTSGKDASSAMVVDANGKGIVNGINSCDYQVVIRPVLHLDLSKNVWKKIGTVSTKREKANDSKHIHTDQTQIVKVPTCYRYGQKKIICTVCHDYYLEAMPKSNSHTGGTEIVNKINPTATVPGWTGDTYCKECGKKLTTGKSIPATGKQTITVAPIKTYKANKLKKKASTFMLGAKASGKGKLKYKVSKTKKKYISVNTKGKVTLKKGIRKGKYEITITAAAKGVYKKTSKVVVVKVK